MSKSFKDHSRTNWTTDQESFPGLERVNAGSLQRIADATEQMAKNIVQLQRDHDWYQDMYRHGLAEIQRLKHSRAGYMAALTKLRRKQNVETNG